jgi:hypothetical protein
MSKITEGTLVPLGVLGSIAVVSVGTIMWLTTIFVQGNANANEIKELKSEMKVLHEIRERVIRIEEKLQKKDSG